MTFTGLKIENYPGGDASWSITSNGQQGTQSVNSSHGTFAMMGAQSGTGTYTFQISVAAGETDDDFIGFALGFNQGEAARPVSMLTTSSWTGRRATKSTRA